MSMLKEFKEFAVKGNMIDMAIGIIIGAAFSTVVKTLVDNVIMPVVGKLTGGTDFSNLFIVLGSGKYETLVAAKEAGAATIAYGLFINALVAFLIVAWVLFLIMKSINKMKRQEPAPEPKTKECRQCFSKVNIKATKCPQCTSEIKEASG